MTRTLIGGAFGCAVAVLLVAGLGAWDGYHNGLPTSRLPPGPSAALTDAFVCVAYFWPVPAACGAAIGAVAGLGSWLVRPRRRVSDRP
jgi:hypothetical protein